MCAGLAYQAYCYVSIHPERFKSRASPDAGPLVSLKQVSGAYHTHSISAEVAKLQADEKYSEAKGFQMPLRHAGFQLELAKLLDAGHAMFLELPTWLDDMPIDAALEQVHKALAVMYLLNAGKPGVGGSFLVLHLITGAWGAEHVVTRMRDEAAQRHGLKCFWAAAVAVLMASGTNVPTPQALQEAWDANDAADDDDSAEAHWAQIVDAACWEEEEHNIKLAYVARQLWLRYGKWQGFRKAAASFTETPDIGPGRSKPFYSEKAAA